MVKEEDRDRDVGDKPFLYNSKRVGSDILSKYGNSEERWRQVCHGKSCEDHPGNHNNFLNCYFFPTSSKIDESFLSYTEC